MTPTPNFIVPVSDVGETKEAATAQPVVVPTVSSHFTLRYDYG